MWSTSVSVSVSVSASVSISVSAASTTVASISVPTAAVSSIVTVFTASKHVAENFLLPVVQFAQDSTVAVAVGPVMTTTVEEDFLRGLQVDFNVSGGLGGSGNRGRTSDGDDGQKGEDCKLHHDVGYRGANWVARRGQCEWFIYIPK